MDKCFELIEILSSAQTLDSSNDNNLTTLSVASLLHNFICYNFRLFKILLTLPVKAFTFTL